MPRPSWKLAADTYVAHTEQHRAPKTAKRYRAVVANAVSSGKFPGTLDATSAAHVAAYLTYRSRTRLAAA